MKSIYKNVNVGDIIKVGEVVTDLIDDILVEVIGVNKYYILFRDHNYNAYGHTYTYNTPEDWEIIQYKLEHGL